MVSFGGKRVLLIGGEGVVLYAPVGKGIEREVAVAWDVPNFTEQLVDALKSKNASKSLVVLFDDADQAYKKEEIPSTIGKFDRASYVKRKISQLFPSHPIRAAMEVRPTKKKSGGFTLTAAPKQSPWYLFAALPELERLDVIGNVLLKSGVPVAGFGLLPVESEGLVAELAAKVFPTDGKKSRWAVIVSQQETGGFRQVFIKDGNLAMTRLIRVSHGTLSGAQWAEEVIKEFRASLAYVSRIGFSAAEGLDLAVICGEIEKQFFDPRALGVTGFKCLTPSEALKVIGAKSSGLDKTIYGDGLFAAWVAKKSALDLPVRIPSIHRIMAPRLVARVGAGLMVLSVLGLSYMTFDTYSAYSGLQDDIEQKQNQKTMLDREYEQESKVFDALPVKPEVVKGIMGVKKTLEDNTVDIAPTLNTFKLALGDDIFLTEFDYKHTPGPALSPKAPSGFLAQAPDPKSRGTVKMSFKFGLPATMLLEQKVNRAEALQKSLESAFPGYNVKIQTQFGNVSREGSFSGGVGETGAAGPATEDLASFEMEGPPL
jgi:hypothetical protein